MNDIYNACKLLFTDSAGTETLKNLVLPGVGRFTIVDHSIVCAEDSASNWFTPFDTIGRPRAEVKLRFWNKYFSLL